jgi:hypothetical protein
VVIGIHRLLLKAVPGRLAIVMISVLAGFQRRYTDLGIGRLAATSPAAATAENDKGE